MAVCRKHRLILFLSVLFLCAGRSRAQEIASFTAADTVSYRLYLSADWRGLETFCNSAIAQGYDYYYMRIRAGIAAFERKRYRVASFHFEKALEFSNNDPLANEYLYYTYIYAGYYDKARLLSRSFDSTFAAAMRTSRLNPIQFISLEAGQKISDTSSRFKPASFLELGIRHYVGRRIGLFHAATFYQQEEFRYSVKQFEYYLNASVPLKHNWTVSAAVHALYYKAGINTYTVDITQAVSGMGALQSETVTVTEGKRDQSRPLFIGSAEVSKSLRYFGFSAGSTVASLDSVVQLQLNAGIGFYPFANNRLIIGGSFYAHTEDLKNRQVSLALSPSVSGWITTRIGASVSYFTNNGVNIAEQNGYLVNNSPDFTTERYSASVWCALYKKMYIYAVCARENKKELTRAVKYNYNIFLLGIKVVPS